MPVSKRQSSVSKTLPPARLLAALVPLMFLLAPILPAHAHYLGESYLFLNIRDASMDGHVDIPLAELGDVLFAGEVTDGILTPEEIETNIERLKSYVSARVGLGTSETWFPMRFTTHEILTSPDVPFVQLHFTVDNLDQVPTELKVRYSVLFSTNPLHRALMVVKRNDVSGTANPGEEVSLIFTKDDQTQTLDITKSSRIELFISYLEHGIFHISIGIDHILFLVALLLSAVLQRQGGRWVPCKSFGLAFRNVVIIVTLFTIAHSITLALAALEIVTLPTRFVESMIALTVVLAALHNFFPLIEKRIGFVVFLFGLFHGFGFANVLSSLGFQELSFVATLLGFNLGVEVGQLIIVSAIFPVLYLFRTHRLYGVVGIGFGSSVIAALGALWFAERALDFSI